MALKVANWGYVLKNGPARARRRPCDALERRTHTQCLHRRRTGHGYDLTSRIASEALMGGGARARRQRADKAPGRCRDPPLTERFESGRPRSRLSDGAAYSGVSSALGNILQERLEPAALGSNPIACACVGDRWAKRRRMKPTRCTTSTRKYRSPADGLANGSNRSSSDQKFALGLASPYPVDFFRNSIQSANRLSFDSDTGTRA